MSTTLPLLVMLQIMEDFIVFIHSTGDYEGNISHTVRSACLFDNGELTHSGRNYDWGFGNNRGHIYGFLNAHLIG